MKKVNPESTKTTISLAPNIKREAIKLAKMRWGKSGNLSILISELLRNELKADATLKMELEESERESIADALKRTSRKRSIKETSSQARQKRGA